jgi:hypothetical protein
VADKMVASQEAVRQRSTDAAEEAKTLEPKLKLIIAKTKELQGEVRCACVNWSERSDCTELYCCWAAQVYSVCSVVNCNCVN